MLDSPFLVEASLTDLSVTVAADAVTEIIFGGRATRSPETALECQVARELTSYLDGTLDTFSFDIHPDGTPFELRVWRELLTIPYGETRTYGDIARAIDVPGAARAVGAANGRNPIPIVIPCHRVVAAGGKLGGFGGGVELKRRLLALESSHARLLS